MQENDSSRLPSRSTQMPSSRTVSASARRRWRRCKSSSFVLRELIERCMVTLTSTRLSARKAPNGGRYQQKQRAARLVCGRPRARLAALCPDEDRRPAAAGGAHARLAHRAGRRPRADRRHRQLVDRLPRLQPAAHPPRGGQAAQADAARDVRRAGARAGADAGAAAGRAAAGRSQPRVLFRFRFGRGRGRAEDGGAILDQSRREGARRSSSPSRAAITATPPAPWR